MWIHCLKWNGEGGRKDRQPNRKTSALINATKAISGFAVPNECSAGGLIEAQQWALLSARHARHPYRSFPPRSEDLLLRPIKTLCSGTTELLFLRSSRYRRLSPKSFGGKEIRGKTMAVSAQAAQSRLQGTLIDSLCGMAMVFDGFMMEIPQHLAQETSLHQCTWLEMPHGLFPILKIFLQLQSRSKWALISKEIPCSLSPSEWAICGCGFFPFSHLQKLTVVVGFQSPPTPYSMEKAYFFLVKAIFTLGNAMSPFQYQWPLWKVNHCHFIPSEELIYIW